MIGFASGRNAAYTAILFLSFWHVNLKDAYSQSDSHSTSSAVVVVAHAEDAPCAQRIGHGIVNVEVLLTSNGCATLADYDRCNKRAQGLLDCQLLLYRNATPCPTERFWIDRMAAANPRTKLCRMTTSRLSSLNERERKIQQATEIHAALSKIVGHHRTILDQNLRTELTRLKSTGNYRQLASRE